MGLDTTHDAWHGAYGSFSRWRNRVAQAAGYRIAKDTEGFEAPVLDRRYSDAECYGEWVETPDDPLVVLIWHSDCGGVIHPAQAAPLADRLEALLPALGDDDGGGHIGIYRDKTQAFIDGLRAAVAAGEDVEFH